LAQFVAGIFPGTSRSAATIFAAMLAGASNRAAATEFAFLVGIPTMYAASAYQLYGQFKEGAPHEDWGALGIAFVVSTITAFIAVKWLLGYIQTHRFTAFAIYRIVFGMLLLGAAALGWLA
jgi:undecaprenyl-diphosphatase